MRGILPWQENRINAEVSMKELPENVKRFEKECGTMVRDHEWEMYDVDLTWMMEETESPIEQLFLSALTALLKVNYLEGEEFSVTRDIFFRRGISIEQQKTIGKYRVDFCLSYTGNVIVDYKQGSIFPNFREEKKIVVELDGHEFHERNQRERKYEKARDRYMQKLGYKVFRYTGSEIVKNPFSAAAECVCYLTGESLENITAGLIVYGKPEWDDFEVQE